MSQLALVASKSGYISKVVHDLVCGGWNISSIPSDGKIPRNGLKLIMMANGQELRLRIFAYKVTTSGRNREHERRIEITTTYGSGLKPLKGFRDVILGVDVDTDKYVGVDNRRLNMGGSTHNASSFFDLEGLSVNSHNLLVNPRHVSSKLFPNGIEQHSFFGQSRLSEYLFNQLEIHSGRYTFQGEFSGNMPTKNISITNNAKLYTAANDTLVLFHNIKTSRSVSKLSPKIITSVEENDFTKLPRRKITPAQLKEILSYCDEIGALGEQAVLAEERKRLHKLGLKDQANKVERVSLWSVGEGYDILSFENDGTTKKYLEVKTTVGTGTVVDVSATEWKAAKRFKEKYYLVRVININGSPKMFYIRNPIELEKLGKVALTTSGWRIDLRSEMSVSA